MTKELKDMEEELVKHGKGEKWTLYEELEERGGNRAYPAAGTPSCLYRRAVKRPRSTSPLKPRMPAKYVFILS
jgi:hypothetical protein